MTSYMNIIVRVVANRAQSVFARLRGEMAATNATANAANRIDPMGRRHLTSLMKFGNQLQWTGRMIQYNFTLPLAIAAGAAAKWALENEKAFVHVAKVYGDTGDAAKQFRKENSKLTQEMAENKAARIFAKELDALKESFEAISNYYGVAQKEVLEVAGAWAAAGASGLDLAKSVDATMQAIIIGDMEAAQATKALISIQAQYNLNSEELMDTLAQLNSVENATGASMQDLIVAYEKAAGVARTAGVTTQELAAYVAALVPASGSAATAGNALKTIFSRLISPTKETVQVLGAMGIGMDDLNWKSATVSEQLQIMSDKFQGLSDKQKSVVATVAASRWQVNRFDILMKELNSDLGFHAKALNASEDAGQNFRRMQKELNAVLESDPRRLQRMWVMLQNASADIIQPLIPYIIYLAGVVANLAQAFSNLDPELQKLILFGLVFLGLIGPVIRYMGALGTLLGVLGFTARQSLKHLFGLASIFKIIPMLFAPILMGFTVLATALGGTAEKINGTMKMTKVIHIGMAAFFGKWTKGVSTLMATFGTVLSGIFGRMGAFLAAQWAAMWAHMSFAALLGSTGITGRFAAMWTFLKGQAVVGWVKLGAIWTGGWVMMQVRMITFQSAIAVRWTAMWVVMQAQMIAALANWKTLLKGAVLMFGRAIGMIAAAMIGPWGVAVAVILTILYAFRSQIAQIWNNIVGIFSRADLGGFFVDLGNTIMGVFNRLPQSVQNAMIAVVTVVRDAALAVYEWFSYLNPFAKHSPSLVENVENGVDRINAKFGELGKVKSIIASVYSEIKKFSNASKGLNLSANQTEVKEDRRAIKKAGGGGAALASYDRMQKLLRQLNPLLAKTEERMNKQQNVVDRWARKLEKANEELEKQQGILDRLNEKLQEWQGLLDDANSRLDYFANAPLEGMRAMEDQIFANTMAQKRLQYEMMQIEKVTGTFDQLQEKMAAVNGLQEILRGTQTDLRAAGAGSEILSQYDSEIAKLEEQKGTYTETFDKLNDMRLELEKLQMQAEELDLVKALKFDELQYQIDRTADQTKELSFDEIISGIQTAQADIAKYTDKVAEATLAVQDQEAAVAEAQKARDLIQDRLDQEQAKLDKITEKYNGIKDAIQAINSAIQDVVASAEKMNAVLDKKKDAAAAKKKGGAGSEGYVSPGLQNFMDAAGGNYPDPGGSGMPPRTDWKSQVKDIEKWTDELSQRTSDMFGDINPFKSLKSKAKEAWDWIVGKAVEAKAGIQDAFGQIFDGVDFGSGVDNVRGFIEPIVEFLTGVFKDIADLAGAAWKLLGPDITKIAKGIWDGLKDIWDRVGPELVEFKELWGPIGEAIANMWDMAKPVLAILAGAILGVIKVGLSIISELIDPAFDLLGDLITGIIKIIRGVVKIIVGIFTADLPMILSGLGDFFTGLWNVIWGIFKAGVRLVWNIVEGFVQGVIGFFEWLWDVLVGNSIVPDIINGVLDWFGKLGDLAQWVWDNVLKPVYDFFVDGYDDVIDSVSGWWSGITGAWKNIKDNVKDWWSKNVWTPVKNGIENWWSGRLSVWSGWWEDIKGAWKNITGNIKDWWLNNIWNPVKNGIESWWEGRLVVWRSWWEALKGAWSNISSNIKDWWFNNIWNPVTNGVSKWWTDTLATFRGWWEALKGAWGNIKDNIGDWWYNNVTSKIYNKITGIFDDIKGYFEKNPNLLKDAIKPIVNGVISGVNAIIKGLNKVSDVLPGDLWNIGEITPMAASGAALGRRRANRGFMTHGARAIVGEGKANHPEFVIPTDPTYRNRAKSLLAMAAQKIGLGEVAASVRNAQMRDEHGIPMFGIGGWLSNAWDETKNLGKKIANLPKKAVGSVMNKVLDKAAETIDKIGYQPVESPPELAILKLRNWVDEFDGAIAKKLDSMTPAGGSVPVADPTAPGAHQYWNGGLFTRRFVAYMEKAEELAGTGVRVMQGGFRPATSYSGTSHQGDAVDFQVSSSLIRAFRAVGIAAGDRTGLGDWDPHTHAIPGPSAGTAGGSAIWQWQDYIARGGASQALNSPWGLKAGGIVKRRTGGTAFRLGDGPNDEAVTPLPRNWKSDGLGGQTHVHFHGATLEFPNITDPADVDLLIQNLVNLAED